MKRVIGIGNALTDMLVNLKSDSVLSRFKLAKGSMSLVDTTLQTEISKSVAGLPYSLSLGGSAGNTIRAMAKLGCDVGFIGKVGQDTTGDFFVQALENLGVEPVIFRGTERSGKCVSLISPDGERTMVTHLGAALELTAEEIETSIFDHYDCLYVEGYLVQNHDLILKAAKTAKECGLKVAVDLASFNIVAENLEFLRGLVRDYVDAMDTHGMDGLGESGWPDAEGLTPNKDAVSFLIETLKTTPDVTILALGPMTNLAKVISRAPECLTNLTALVSMGGSYKSHGNCSPVAEYNYWCDPDAAAEVFRAFSELPQLAGKKLHMIGLDVTRKIVLTPNLVEYMKCVNPGVGTRIEELTRFYFDFHWKQEKVIGCVINDPLAAAYLVDPSLCSGFDAYTQVETGGLCIGQTVVDAMNFYQKAPNSHILTQVDVRRFFLMFFERVLGVPQEESAPVLDQILTAPPVFPHETMFQKGGEA